MQASFSQLNRKARLLVAALVTGFATLSVVVLPARVASAATDAVTTCSGNATVPGSLPYEVAKAASGDTITFSLSCPASSPIVLSSSININKNLTIDGPGPSAMAVSGNMADTVFRVNEDDYQIGSYTVTISGITIEDGVGGIIQYDSDLTILDDTVSGNTLEGDGAGNSSSLGELTVIDSTVSNNVSTETGGGIENDNSIATITNSTVSNNAAGYGGGIFNEAQGILTVTDSTLSGNTAN
jgi:hypothetical protein